ncbi:26S proteasome regulatory subunit RPN5 [Intoshia linei]|uniref:26S proteasome regulatory subunit RPN5 n=1 Tax=Intoshia linei TaxID=1819745 RepID=A0A177B2S7_9BILA|nr:26S proteasome regulatory subunit RPN5 [Intoshia linei]
MYEEIRLLSEIKLQTDEVDTRIPKAIELAKENKFDDAMEMLFILEKQCRTGGDIASNSKVILTIIDLCKEYKKWEKLMTSLVVLSKKYGQMRESIKKMVNATIILVDELESVDPKISIELLQCIRKISQGKIYVEVERARLGVKLSKICENENNLSEATEIILDMQVETYGSMEISEKVAIILEQMRLSLLQKDYVRTQIISKKINCKYFEKPDTDDEKIRYYTQLNTICLHDKKYIDVCKNFIELYNTKKIVDSESDRIHIIKAIVIFILLSDYNEEYNILLNQIRNDKPLDDISIYKELVNMFIGSKLIKWEVVKDQILKEFEVFPLFVNDKQLGIDCLMNFRCRVIDHDIRVIAMYYNRIRFSKMEKLLKIDIDEAESAIANLVTNGVLVAKINRILDKWSHSMFEIMTKINKIDNLLSKEGYPKTKPQIPQQIKRLFLVDD